LIPPKNTIISTCENRGRAEDREWGEWGGQRVGLQGGISRTKKITSNSHTRQQTSEDEKGRKGNEKTSKCNSGKGKPMGTLVQPHAKKLQPPVQSQHKNPPNTTKLGTLI